MAVTLKSIKCRVPRDLTRKNRLPEEVEACERKIRRIKVSSYFKSC